MSSNIPPARNVKIKRAYEKPARGVGVRVLIDRRWPRGLTKEHAALDQWEKDLAPSTELRAFFGHDPLRWDEFRERYAEEVHNHPYQLRQLRVLARKGPLTLIHSAHDEAHNDQSCSGSWYSAGRSLPDRRRAARN